MISAKPISRNRTISAVILMTVGVATCGREKPEAMALSDLIADSAMRLNRTGEQRTTLEYQLTLETDSLVAIVPSSGFDIRALPPGTTDAQRANLEEAVKTWPGHEIVAIVSLNGVSSGPGIERHVLTSRQMAVLKPPRGKVSVALERRADGQVTLTRLQ